jgi:DNA-binding MarR family transcriptional regulator
MPDHRARLAGRIAFELRLAHEAAQQSLAAALAEIGLGPVHADALTLIGAHPGIKPSELADALARDRSSITAALHALDQRGLLRRESAMRDRRTALLHLTPAGQEALRATAAIVDAHERLLDRIVGETDKPRVTEMLRRIAAALTDGGSPQ